MKSFLIIFAALFLVSCGAPRYLVTPNGEPAIMTFRNENVSPADVELLFMTDSLVYVKYYSRYERIPSADISKISVQGFAVPAEQKILASIPAIILEAVIFGAASSIHSTGWQVGSVMAMAGTAALYATGGPKTSFRPRFSKGDLVKLRLYCRYPQGLTTEQWLTVLQASGQSDFYEHAKPARVAEK